MIAAYLRQLQYMQDSMSYSAMSRELGLTVYKLKSIISGTRDIDSSTKKVIQNAYRRTAYSNMIDVGMSVNNARKYSTYTPEAVSMYTGLYQQTIADLTIGGVAQKLFWEGLPTNTRNINKYFDDVYNKVLTGIKTADNDLQDIFVGNYT